MEKIINISGKDYHMKSSAFTQFAYKNHTGRSFLSDVQKLSGITVDDLTNVDGLIELLLDVSYVMIKEADPTKFASEEDFLKSIDSLFDEPDWVEQVIALAITPISGNLQKNIEFPSK